MLFPANTGPKLIPFFYKIDTRTYVSGTSDRHTFHPVKWLYGQSLILILHRSLLPKKIKKEIKKNYIGINYIYGWSQKIFLKGLLYKKFLEGPYIKKSRKILIIKR